MTGATDHPRRPATWAVTGAAGQVGAVVRPALRQRLDRVRLLDVVPIDDVADGEEFVSCDITDPGRVGEVLAGVDGVVHLAAIADDVAFDEVAAVNIAGTHRVLEAARRGGVPRVVFASSSHVTGMYRSDEMVSIRSPLRPDGHYAVSKVAGEALGRMYADKFGLEFVAIRIGSCVPKPIEARHRHTWLSPGDTVAAFWTAMTASCDGFAMFYGVSANTGRWWSLADGEALGYHPADDADRIVGRGPAYRGFQGGDFATNDPDSATR